MTKIGLTVILGCLLLSLVHGLQEPRCDSIGYGQPQPASCNKLIPNQFPPGNFVSRFFGLETFNKPRGISTNQFAHRIRLPFFRENCRWSSFFKVCCGLLTVVLDGCKIAFLAIRFLNGSVSYDTSSWGSIRDKAQRLRSTCCGAPHAESQGGNLVVGEFSTFHSSQPYSLPLYAQVIILGLL